MLGNLAGNLFLGTLLGNLLLGTLAWEPVPGNLLGTLLGNLFLGTLLGNLAWEPLPGNLAWEPLPGNPVPNLALCGFGCSEGFSWKRRPFLGTRFPTLRRADLAALTCSGTLTMAEDQKLTLLGNKRTFGFSKL